MFYNGQYEWSVKENMGKYARNLEEKKMSRTVNDWESLLS